MGKARGAPPHGAAPRPPSVAPRARIPPPRKTDILYNLGQRLSARPKIHGPSGTKYTFCAEVRQAGHSGTPTGGRGAPFLLSQQPPLLPHPRKRSRSLVCFRYGPTPGPGRSLALASAFRAVAGPGGAAASCSYGGSTRRAQPPAKIGTTSILFSNFA